jgi:hypothetical protein
MLLRIKNSVSKQYPSLSSLIFLRFSSAEGQQKGSMNPKKFLNIFQDSKSHASQYAFLKYELTQNPEFDKAFPHLAQNKDPTKLSRDLAEKDFVKSLL